MQDVARPLGGAMLENLDETISLEKDPWCFQKSALRVTSKFRVHRGPVSSL